MKDHGAKGLVGVMKAFMKKHKKFLAILLDDNRFMTAKGVEHYHSSCMEIQLSSK